MIAEVRQLPFNVVPGLTVKLCLSREERLFIEHLLCARFSISFLDKLAVRYPKSVASVGTQWGFDPRAFLHWGRLDNIIIIRAVICWAPTMGQALHILDLY